MKAKVFTIIPSFADVQFWDENNIILISNLIFYLTFFFLLYTTNKSFAKLICMGIESPKYQNNLWFKKILHNYKKVFYLIITLVIISLIWDCSQIYGGEKFWRTPLHYTRLFKLIIALTLFIANSIVKIISGEKLTLWHKTKVLLLFTPIIIQYLMDYDFLTSVPNLLTLLFLNIPSFNFNFMAGLPYKPGVFSLDRNNIIVENKTGKIYAMVNNSGENSDGDSSSDRNLDKSGRDKGKQPAINSDSDSDKGKEPESSSKKDKGKQPVAADDSDSENDKKGKIKTFHGTWDPLTKETKTKELWVKEREVGWKRWERLAEETKEESKGSTSAPIKGSTSGEPLSSVTGRTHGITPIAPADIWVPTRLPPTSDSASWIRAFDSDPKAIPRASRSHDIIGTKRLTSEARPATAPETSETKVKENKWKEFWGKFLNTKGKK